MATYRFVSAPNRGEAYWREPCCNSHNKPRLFPNMEKSSYSKDWIFLRHRTGFAISRPFHWSKVGADHRQNTVTCSPQTIAKCSVTPTNGCDTQSQWKNDYNKAHPVKHPHVQYALRKIWRQRYCLRVRRKFGVEAFGSRHQ